MGLDAKPTSLCVPTNCRLRGCRLPVGMSAVVVTGAESVNEKAKIHALLCLRSDMRGVEEAALRDISNTDNP